MDIILRYFTQLSAEQKTQLEMLNGLYREWNDRINVISRKDIDHLYEHHVLHSLAIAKFIHFVPGTDLFDLGTGGGFPGIPLAILFPECRFTLADGTAKKIMVVNEIVSALGLKNVKAVAKRAEEMHEKYDFVVTRAVAKADKLLPWAKRLTHHRHKNSYPNGLIALKGNVREEVNLLSKHEYREIIPIQKYFSEPFFEEKFILYVQT